MALLWIANKKINVFDYNIKKDFITVKVYLLAKSHEISWKEIRWNKIWILIR